MATWESAGTTTLPKIASAPMPTISATPTKRSISTKGLYRTPGTSLPYYSASEPKMAGLYQPPQPTALQASLQRLGRTFVNPYVRTGIDALYTTYKFSRPQFRMPPTTPQVFGYPTSLLRATGIAGALAEVSQMGGSTPDIMRQTQWANWVNQAGVAGASRTYTPPTLFSTQR